MSRIRKRLSTLGAVMLVVIIVIPVLSPGAWAQSKYKTLYKFTGGVDGEEPLASLVFDQAGNLYGTTESGGGHGGGTVFKLTHCGQHNRYAIQGQLANQGSAVARAGRTTSRAG
jgi:uncharacterized repeat protein (TIGR03803 family)